jgi:hypothetical protein
LQTYQKDKVVFIEVFTKPVEELKLMKKTLHHIIENEGEDTEVRIKAINQLQSVNVQMLDYYRQLPQVMGIVTTTTTVQQNTNNNDNNNNSTTTITPSQYIEWCKNNNPKHPDSCNCHWDEYQV